MILCHRKYGRIKTNASRVVKNTNNSQQSILLFTKQLYRRTKNVKSSDMRIWSQAMMATFNSGFLSTKCQTFLCFSVHFHGNVFTINSFFQSSGYCWCVNSTSGRPIPGTSLHNARPNCKAPTGGKEPFQIYLSTDLNTNLWFPVCLNLNPAKGSVFIPPMCTFWQHRVVL